MTYSPNHLGARLYSPDEEVRLAAISALKEKADGAALTLLDQALGDSSWRVRKAAVELIKDYRERDRVAPLLIAALGDQDNAGRRSAAVEALVTIGPESVPYLLKELNHPDGDVRKSIVDILGEIKDPSVVDGILPMTRDPQENIRLASVETLGAIGGDKSFEALLSLLPSEDVSLQFGVLYALGKIGKPLPIQQVKPLVEKRILRRAVYDALGQTRSAEAIELISEGLLDPAKSTRQAAVRALYQLGEMAGLEKLVEQNVQKRLADLPLQPFADFLETNHLLTKKAAIKLLSILGTPEAVRILVRAAHDDSIQADITEALSAIKGQWSPELTAEIEAERSSAVPEALRALRVVPAEPRAIGPMSQEQFTRVRDIVVKESGLYYDLELKYLVERRVQRRMEFAGLTDYEEYLRRLTGFAGKDRDELKKLINALSTNETYFFREDFQLKAFQEEILPELIQAKERLGSRRLRVWSAGCSTGEEPYTVAVMVKESLPKEDGFTVEIIGSDINDEIIAQAKKGVYNPSSFRVTPDSFLKKYFTAAGNKFRLSEDIKKMVSFDTQNLLTAASADQLQNLDVIFCRNVIIYFSPEAKRKVVETFYQLLNPGGYLLLGHSESLMSVSTRFELVHLKHDMVYRKPLPKRRP